MHMVIDRVTPTIKSWLLLLLETVPAVGRSGGSSTRIAHFLRINFLGYLVILEILSSVRWCMR